MESLPLDGKEQPPEHDQVNDDIVPLVPIHNFPMFAWFDDVDHKANVSFNSLMSAQRVPLST